MKAKAIDDEINGQSGTHQDSASESDVFQNALLVWHELRCLAYQQLQLAALETRRAGESLAVLVVAAIILAVVLIGIWLALSALVVLGLLEQGMSASHALLAAIAGNLLLVLVLWRVLRHYSHFLLFPATLHSLHAVPGQQQYTGKP